MYRILIGARICWPLFMILFLALNISSIRTNIIENALVMTIFLSLFVDASLSYFRPQLVEQAPANSLISKLLKSSPFSIPEPSKGYRLSCMIVTAVISIMQFARLLALTGYGGTKHDCRG